MTDQQSRDLARADHARQILGDEMVQAALAAVKASIRDQLFDLPIEAAKSREFLALMDKSRQQFEAYFIAAIQDGEVVRLDVQAERDAMERVARIQERARNV